MQADNIEPVDMKQPPLIVQLGIIRCLQAGVVAAHGRLVALSHVARHDRESLANLAEAEQQYHKRRDQLRSVLRGYAV
jgi:hypothetical protein